MNVRDMFDNPYLAADDLRDRPWTLTIKSVAPGRIPKPGSSKVDKRPIVRFVELEAKATKDAPAKGLVINATNYKTIRALYGKTAEEWVGKRITIFPTTCRFGSDPHRPCIRVEPDVPPPAKKSGAGDEKDIPKQVDPPLADPADENEPHPPCTKTPGCGGDEGHDGDCSP